jgi:hypothetical protein
LPSYVCGQGLFVTHLTKALKVYISNAVQSALRPSSAASLPLRMHTVADRVRVGCCGARAAPRPRDRADQSPVELSLFLLFLRNERARAAGEESETTSCHRPLKEESARSHDRCATDVSAACRYVRMYVLFYSHTCIVCCTRQTFCNHNFHDS